MKWEGKFTVEHHLRSLENYLAFTLKMLLKTATKMQRLDTWSYLVKSNWLLYAFISHVDVVKITYTIQIE